MPIDLDSRWPGWPEGEPGQLALDVALATPVDDAFLLIYGGNNEMRRAVDEANGNKDFSTTPWLPSAEAVEAAAAEPSPPPLDASGLAALRPGWLRRASYSGSMMGSKFRNEELYRLQEVAPGASYRVLTTVLTTAMHGEKFRPVVQASLVALPDGRSRYTVRTTILFVSKPNGFIKAMIDKGAREGQRKNFEALRKALAQHTRVSEAPAALPAAPAAAAAEAAPAVEPEAAAPAAAAGLLETLAGTTAFRQLQPWAAWLHTRLDAAAPAVATFVDTQVLLALLCMAALLGALRLVVDMLLFIQHAAAQPRDTIGLLTHHLLRVVDVPESMQEVLVSCLILYTVRLVVNRLAGALPAPPRATAPASAGAASAEAVPVAAAAGAAGAAAAVGAVDEAAARKARSEEAEGEGIKYEGYAEAIAAAQAQPISPAVSGMAAPSSLEEAASGASKGGSLMKSITKSVTSSFTGAFAPASRSRKSSAAGPAAAAAVGAALGAAAGAAAAGVAGAAAAPAAAAGSAGAAAAPAAAGAAGAAAGAAASSPHVGPLAEGLTAALPAGLPARSSIASVRSALSEDEGEGGRQAAAASSPPVVPAAGPGVLRSKSDGEALQRASLAAVSPSPGSEASQQSPDRSMSPVPDRRRTSGGSGVLPSSPGGGVPHSKSAGTLAQEQQAGAAEQSGSSVASFFLGSRRPRSMLSPSGQPSSPREAGPEGAPTGSPSPDQMLSPTAAQRDFRPAMPAHLPPGLASKAVIEEVFENQRLQPFRGWGHSWPGHFLPTDKVNHWSRREQEGFPVLAGADFSTIAPPLPEGWQWCEEKWHLDLSPQIIDACDAEGWSYGLDFPFVKHPFQPNSGRKKISDFVRRRRWIRTRVPLELAAPRATAISADTSSWDKELGPAAALADASTGVFSSLDSEAAAEQQEVEAPGSAAAASSPGSTSSSPGPVSSGARLAALGAATGGAAVAAASEAAVAGGAPAAGQPAATAGLGSLPPSESSEMREVHAVLESIFARVEERSASTVQADMLEALAQQIGTRSPSKPVAQRQPAAEPSAAAPAAAPVAGQQEGQLQEQPTAERKEEPVIGDATEVPAQAAEPMPAAAAAAAAGPDEAEAVEEKEERQQQLALQVVAGAADEAHAEAGAASAVSAQPAVGAARGPAGSVPAEVAVPAAHAAAEQEAEDQAGQPKSRPAAEEPAAVPAVPLEAAAEANAPATLPTQPQSAAAETQPEDQAAAEQPLAAEQQAAAAAAGGSGAAGGLAEQGTAAEATPVVPPPAAPAAEEAPAAAAAAADATSGAAAGSEEDMQAEPSPTLASGADSLHLVASR